MQSTMMDYPLTVRHIFEHGRALYGDSEVVTCEADGARRIEFAALADRAEQLAAGLRRLGIGPGDRVATFGWNNQEHQEAYFAIPGMGAVMHTLNIRLAADQLRYIIGHAEDSVIIADASLAPVLGPVLAEAEDEVKTVRHLIVYGDSDRSALPEHLDYEELLAAEKPGYPWPEIDEHQAAAMCYTSGTTGLPKGVVYSHRSAFLHTLGVSSGEALAINQNDRVLQGWGLTETSPVASLSFPPKHAPAARALDYRATAGRPLGGVEARVVDDEGKVLPRDGQATGEIEVRGPWVTAGYYKDPAPDKFRDGWLRTGDVGRIDPRGYITISDRAKDVVKSGGEWISTLELESAILTHPAVREAAVIAAPDARWGERPLACITCVPGQSVTAEELRAHLAGRVVKWWLPDQWVFLDEVPRTTVGKHDKKLLRERNADGSLPVVTTDGPSAK